MTCIFFAQPTLALADYPCIDFTYELIMQFQGSISQIFGAKEKSLSAP